jgi:hypothetical protein
MPLFGSNFAQGFATGFAESASKSIDNAVAQRDADVSAAKKFAMTRAAQLEEQALEKDKRTQNAIKKMASRFTKGGETDWNRVYGAIMATDGGDLDSLDALFENMKNTDEKGIKFDINDVFKYVEGDETLAKLSRDDIFQALRAEYEPPTVRATDTTFLSKVGLGAGETGGQRADEQVRGLFPGATRTSVEGDYGTTTLDQGALSAAVEYGMKIKEYEKNMTPSLAEAFADVTSRIGKLDPESPTYETDKAKLEKEYLRSEQNLQAYTRATTEQTTTPGSMTASGFSKVITDGEASALQLAGIGDTFFMKDGEQVPIVADPGGYAEAKQRALNSYYERHVRGQMDGNGELSFLGQQVILNRPELKAIYDRIIGSEEATDTSVAIKKPDNAAKIAELVQKGPEVYGSKWLKANPKLGAAGLYKNLIQMYPRESQLVSLDQHRQQLADVAKSIFNKYTEETDKPAAAVVDDVFERNFGEQTATDKEEANTQEFTPEIQQTITALSGVASWKGVNAKVEAVMEATKTDEAGARALIEAAVKAQEEQEAAQMAAKPASELSPPEAANRVRDNLSGSKEDYDKAIDAYVIATKGSRTREQALEMFPYKGQTS